MEGSQIDHSLALQTAAHLCSILRNLRVESSKSEPPDLAQQICKLPDIDRSLEWFLSSPEYKVWRQTSISKLLVSGDHGDGKTVLLSYILKGFALEHLYRADVETVSIFCSSTDTEMGLAACLAYQFLQKSKIRVKAARMEVAEFRRLAVSSLATYPLWNLLNSLIIAGSGIKTFFIIDGIDKLDERVRIAFLDHLSHIIKDVSVTSRPIRVLISSQTYENMGRELTNYLMIDRDKKRRGRRLVEFI